MGGNSPEFNSSNTSLSKPPAPAANTNPMSMSAMPNSPGSMSYKPSAATINYMQQPGNMNKPGNQYMRLTPTMSGDQQTSYKLGDTSIQNQLKWFEQNNDNPSQPQQQYMPMMMVMNPFGQQGQQNQQAEYKPGDTSVQNQLNWFEQNKKKNDPSQQQQYAPMMMFMSPFGQQGQQNQQPMQSPQQNPQPMQNNAPPVKYGDWKYNIGDQKVNFDQYRTDISNSGGY